jgi:hypothetical protein
MLVTVTGRVSSKSRFFSTFFTVQRVVVSPQERIFSENIRGDSCKVATCKKVLYVLWVGLVSTEGLNKLHHSWRSLLKLC